MTYPRIFNGGHCSERYVSYWNACLFSYNFKCISYISEHFVPSKNEDENVFVAHYSHLSGCFWLQNFGRWQDVSFVFLFKNERSLSGMDNDRWWGHSNPTSW